jgi:hypothetical protein
MADEIKAAFKVRSVAKSKFTRAETILNEALGATDIQWLPYKEVLMI